MTILLKAREPYWDSLALFLLLLPHGTPHSHSAAPASINAAKYGPGYRTAHMVCLANHDTQPGTAGGSMDQPWVSISHLKSHAKSLCAAKSTRFPPGKRALFKQISTEWA